MTKSTKNYLCAKRRLRAACVFIQSDQSLLCALLVAKDPNLLQVDSEVIDQTGRMLKLIWVFAGHTGHFIGFVILRRDNSE